MNKIKSFFRLYSASTFIVINFLFILFYLVLSFYNRFTLEGLEILVSIKTKGLPEAIKYYYLNWGGSFISLFYYYLYFGFVSSFEGLTLALFVYYIVSMFILIYSVYYIITIISKLYCIQSPSFIERINYSIFFCSLVFWGTFQITDTWFWVNSSFRYLQTIIFTCVIIALIVKMKNGFIDYIIIALCGLYIGGTFEIYAFILLCLYILYLWMYNKKISWRHGTMAQKKLITAAIFIATGLVIMISAPGNYTRLQFEAQNFNESIGPPVTVQQNVLGIFNIIFQKKNIAFFILVVVWFFTAIQIGEIKKSIDTKKLTVFLFLALAIAAIVSIIAFTFIFKKDHWPMRAWMPANFIFVCFLFICTVLFGTRIKIRKFNAESLFVLCSIISIGISIAYIARQYPLVSAYSSAYDKRVEMLVKNKNNKINNYVLPEIPQPGMLVQTIVTEKEISRLNLK